MEQDNAVALADLVGEQHRIIKALQRENHALRVQLAEASSQTDDLDITVE